MLEIEVMTNPVAPLAPAEVGQVRQSPGGRIVLVTVVRDFGRDRTYKPLLLMGNGSDDADDVFTTTQLSYQSLYKLAQDYPTVLDAKMTINREVTK